MAIETFADLKTAITDFMFDRSDLAGFADNFIQLCEGDLNRVLRTRDQLTTATLTLDADSKSDLPADYLEARNAVALTTPRARLSQVAPDYIEDTYPSRQSGYPRVYVIEGGNIIVLPETTSSIEFTYYAKIPALSEANTTNWLLTKFPNIYLYGCLMHANEFIGNAERMARMAEMFKIQVDSLVSDDKGAMWPRGNARVAGVNP